MTPQEEYHLFLDYVVKTIERRGTITTTYLSVNAAIIGAIAFVVKDILWDELWKYTAVLGLTVAGLIACNLWIRLNRQYSILLRWWYEKLRSLEEVIPGSHQLLTAEYHDLYAPGSRNISLMRYERGLAWLFTALYLITGAVLVEMMIVQYMMR